MTAEERRFLAWLSSIDHFDDGWNEILRRVLLSAFTDFQTRAELSGQWSLNDGDLERISEKILELPEAALTRAELLLAVDANTHIDEIEALIKRFADQVQDPGLSKRHLARFYYLIARIAQRNGHQETFRKAIMTSLEYWRSTRNPAFSEAQRMRNSSEQRNR